MGIQETLNIAFARRISRRNLFGLGSATGLLLTIPDLACSGQDTAVKKVAVGATPIKEVTTTLEKEEDGIKTAIFFPQGVQKPETGRLTYTFSPRSLEIERLLQDEVGKTPFRMVSLFAVSPESQLRFMILLGRDNEATTRIFVQGQIKVEEPALQHILELGWENWTLRKKLWDGNEVSFTPNQQALQWPKPSEAPQTLVNLFLPSGESLA